MTLEWGLIDPSFSLYTLHLFPWWGHGHFPPICLMPDGGSMGGMGTAGIDYDNIFRKSSIKPSGYLYIFLHIYGWIKNKWLSQTMMIFLFLKFFCKKMFL